MVSNTGLQYRLVQPVSYEGQHVGKTYIIVNAFNLLNYKQDPQGYIFVALDNSEHVKKLQSSILLILFLSSVLILISFSILYFSYGSLLQKIMDRNIALEQSNDNLERQVEHRTAKLQQEITERKKIEKELREALDNIKTLSGLLPICAHCKKIRDDKGYWNQIEGFIDGRQFLNLQTPGTDVNDRAAARSSQQRSSGEVALKDQLLLIDAEKAYLSYIVEV